jgi:hypothetical protein
VQQQQAMAQQAAVQLAAAGSAFFGVAMWVSSRFN